MDAARLIAQLLSAVSAAQLKNFNLMQDLVEEVRDASYDLSERYVAFKVREICALLERIPTMQDFPLGVSSVNRALKEIDVRQEGAFAECSLA
jgi:hypothetical protein